MAFFIYILYLIIQKENIFKNILIHAITLYTVEEVKMTLRKLNWV